MQMDMITTYIEKGKGMKKAKKLLQLFLLLFLAVTAALLSKGEKVYAHNLSLTADGTDYYVNGVEQNPLPDNIVIAEDEDGSINIVLTDVSDFRYYNNDTGQVNITCNGTNSGSIEHHGSLCLSGSGSFECTSSGVMASTSLCVDGLTMSGGQLYSLGIEIKNHADITNVGIGSTNTEVLISDSSVSNSSIVGWNINIKNSTISDSRQLWGSAGIDISDSTISTISSGIGQQQITCTNSDITCDGEIFSYRGIAFYNCHVECLSIHSNDELITFDKGTYTVKNGIGAQCGSIDIKPESELHILSAGNSYEILDAQKNLTIDGAAVEINNSGGSPNAQMIKVGGLSCTNSTVKVTGPTGISVSYGSGDGSLTVDNSTITVDCTKAGIHVAHYGDSPIPSHIKDSEITITNTNTSVSSLDYSLYLLMQNLEIENSAISISDTSPNKCMTISSSKLSLLSGTIDINCLSHGISMEGNESVLETKGGILTIDNAADAGIYCNGNNPVISFGGGEQTFSSVNGSGINGNPPLVDLSDTVLDIQARDYGIMCSGLTTKNATLNISSTAGYAILNTDGNHDISFVNTKGILSGRDYGICNPYSKTTFTDCNMEVSGDTYGAFLIGQTTVSETESGETILILRGNPGIMIPNKNLETNSALIYCDTETDGQTKVQKQETDLNADFETYKYVEIRYARYRVTFLDYDGRILKEELVRPGKDATAPEVDTARPGYHFSSWDTSYTNVSADIVCTAVYEADPAVKEPQTPEDEPEKEEPQTPEDEPEKEEPHTPEDKPDKEEPHAHPEPEEVRQEPSIIKENSDAPTEAEGTEQSAIVKEPATDDTEPVIGDGESKEELVDQKTDKQTHAKIKEPEKQKKDCRWMIPVMLCILLLLLLLFLLFSRKTICGVFLGEENREDVSIWIENKKNKSRKELEIDEEGCFKYTSYFRKEFILTIEDLYSDVVFEMEINFKERDKDSYKIITSAFRKYEIVTKRKKIEIDFLDEI